MEEQELIRRAQDLCDRSAKRWETCHTSFLTPAERMILEKRFHPEPGIVMRFCGGYESCERSIAVFRPEEAEETPENELIRAVHYRAFFGEPGHRDYLGALLASGIVRDRLGDIVIRGSEAWVFCLPGIVGHLAGIERIGRVSVRAEEVPAESVRVPEPERKEIRFTVMSPRADAVAAGMFRLSRTRISELIREGLLNLNYTVCEKTDAPVCEGDVLSLRGYGKGRIAEFGGNSRKGRLFVTAELYQ